MRIAQLSQHVGQGLPRVARMIALRDIDVAGLTELNLHGHDDLTTLREVLGDKYLVYGRLDVEVVAVFKRKRFWRTTDVIFTKLSNDIPDRPGGAKGLGNERWLLEVCRQHLLTRRKRSHLFTHLNAGIQNALTGKVAISSPRAIANALSMAKIRNRIVRRQAQGFEVSLQADFNVRDRGDWTFLPNLYLKKQLPQFRLHGLDWILFTHNVQVLTETVIPKETDENPSDHPGLVLDIKGI